MMKKILLLTTALFLCLAVVVKAQQPQREQREKMTPEQQATRMVANLNKELKLSEEQQTELKKWFTTTFTQRGENMKKHQGDREAMRAQMKKDWEATDAKLKKVLTTEQYKQYKENQEKRRQEGRKGGRPGYGGPRGGGHQGDGRPQR